MHKTKSWFVCCANDGNVTLRKILNRSEKYGSSYNCINERELFVFVKLFGIAYLTIPIIIINPFQCWFI